MLLGRLPKRLLSLLLILSISIISACSGSSGGSSSDESNGGPDPVPPVGEPDELVDVPKYSAPDERLVLLNKGLTFKLPANQIEVLRSEGSHLYGKGFFDSGSERYFSLDTSDNTISFAPVIPTFPDLVTSNSTQTALAGTRDYRGTSLWLADASGIKVMTDDSSLNIDNLDFFSPDGTKFLYIDSNEAVLTEEPHRTGQDLYIYDIATGNKKKINRSDIPEIVTSAYWAGTGPDAKVVYEVWDLDPEQSDIFPGQRRIRSVESSGKNNTLLAAAGERLKISPDGQNVLFYNSGLYVVSIEGGDPKLIDTDALLFKNGQHGVIKVDNDSVIYYADNESLSINQASFTASDVDSGIDTEIEPKKLSGSLIPIYANVSEDKLFIWSDESEGSNGNKVLNLAQGLDLEPIPLNLGLAAGVDLQPSTLRYLSHLDSVVYSSRKEWPYEAGGSHFFSPVITRLTGESTSPSFELPANLVYYGYQISRDLKNISITAVDQADLQNNKLTELAFIADWQGQVEQVLKPMNSEETTNSSKIQAWIGDKVYFTYGERKQLFVLDKTTQTVKNLVEQYPEYVASDIDDIATTSKGAIDVLNDIDFVTPGQRKSYQIVSPKNDAHCLISDENVFTDSNSYVQSPDGEWLYYQTTIAKEETEQRGKVALKRIKLSNCERENISAQLWGIDPENNYYASYLHYLESGRIIIKRLDQLFSITNDGLNVTWLNDSEKGGLPVARSSTYTYHYSVSNDERKIYYWGNDLSLREANIITGRNTLDIAPFSRMGSGGEGQKVKELSNGFGYIARDNDSGDYAFYAFDNEEGTLQQFLLPAETTLITRWDYLPSVNTVIVNISQGASGIYAIALADGSVKKLTGSMDEGYLNFKYLLYPELNKVVYSAKNNDVIHWYAATMDGSLVTKLTNAGIHSYATYGNKVGSALVYRGTGNSDVKSIDLDTLQVTLLLAKESFQGINVLEDKQQIVYITKTDEEGLRYLKRMNISDQMELGSIKLHREIDGLKAHEDGESLLLWSDFRFYGQREAVKVAIDSIN